MDETELPEWAIEAIDEESLLLFRCSIFDHLVVASESLWDVVSAADDFASSDLVSLDSVELAAVESEGRGWG